MLSYFERLEVEYDKDANELIIPTFRQDLNRDADIAEEVARFFGYDNIPTTLPKGETTMGKISFEQSIEDAASDRKSTRLNSSHNRESRMPSSA